MLFPQHNLHVEARPGHSSQTAVPRGELILIVPEGLSVSFYLFSKA
jgi:hypothetical protein